MQRKKEKDPAVVQTIEKDSAESISSLSKKIPHPSPLEDLIFPHSSPRGRPVPWIPDRGRCAVHTSRNGLLVELPSVTGCGRARPLWGLTRRPRSLPASVDLLRRLPPRRRSAASPPKLVAVPISCPMFSLALRHLQIALKSPLYSCQQATEHTDAADIACRRRR